MSNLSLTEALDEIFVSDKICLPVTPAVAQQLLTKADQIKSIEELKQLIEQDPSLICNLFRAANSSFFKGLNQTDSLEDAITRLGQEKTVLMLQAACREAKERSGDNLVLRYQPRLLRHSIGCALGARWLANRCGYQGLSQQAYLSGLLHDIGKLFLITGLEEISSSDRFEIHLSDQIIDEVLQTMHVEQGVKLIQQWNLPETFQLVVSNHHNTDAGNQDITLALVKLANKGCHKIGLGWEQDRSLVLPTSAEAQFLGISEIALAEYEIMLEDRFLGDNHSL